MSPRRPFGPALVVGLVAVIALPLVVIAGIQAAIFKRDRDDIARGRLFEVAHSIGARIDDQLEMHMRAVQVFAHDTQPGQDLNERLRRHHRVYPGFLTMLATDSAGVVIARDPQRSRDGRNLLAQRTSVSDRAYFRVPRDTLRPYLSDVFQGRGFGTDIIVAVSAPLRTSSGEFAGIVEGSLDLSRLRQYAAEPARIPGTKVLVLDSAGRVIFSAGARSHAPLSPAADLLAHTRESDIVTFAFEGERHLFARAGTRNGWTVITGRPVSVVHAAVHWALLLVIAGVLVALVVSVFLARWITARATHPLRESEQRYRELVDLSLGFICIHDLDGVLLDVNPAAAEALGRTREEMIGRPLQSFVNPALLHRFTEYLRRIQTTGHDEGVIVIVDRDGNDRVWTYRNRLLRDADPPRVIGNATDITERYHAEQLLRDQAATDPLTGLANRTLFLERLHRALHDIPRDHLMGLLFVDLDGFKQINDEAGHDAGDQLLCELATRLRSSVRRSDTVARLGGDEFAVILSELDTEARAESLAHNILEAIVRPYSYRERTMEITASIGISLHPRDGTSAEVLLEKADRAMYEAKRRGKNCIMVA